MTDTKPRLFGLRAAIAAIAIAYAAAALAILATAAPTQGRQSAGFDAGQVSLEPKPLGR